MKSGKRTRMRLVLFVRKLDSNDSRMSFFSEWIKQFAKHAEHIDIITWQQSNDADAPTNTTLHILQGGTFKKVLQLQFVLLKTLRNADAMYCHMNPEYTIVSSPLAFIMRVPIVHWYAHGAVTFRRKLVEVFAKHVVTSSPKGFREPLFNKKVHIVGQGIDTELFLFSNKEERTDKYLIYVGRISPVKDLESVIKAVGLLKQYKVHFDVYGDPAMKEDSFYLESLKAMVEKAHLNEQVTFHGGVPYKKLPSIFQNADAFVNMSTTGSMDKTVLEAFSSGTAVFTANEAYERVLPEEYMVKQDDFKLLAKQLDRYFQKDHTSKSIEAIRLRAFVENEHSLSKLVEKIKVYF